MPRYYFHSVDGGRENDHEGIELEDYTAARNEAMAYAGEVLKGDPEKIWARGQWRVEVTDETRRLLFTVVTLSIDAPPLSDSKPADLAG